MRVKMVDVDASEDVIDLGVVPCDATIKQAIQSEFGSDRRWIKFTCPKHCENIENPDNADTFGHTTPFCKVSQNNGLNLVRWSYPPTARHVFVPTGATEGRKINSRNQASYKFYNVIDNLSSDPVAEH